MRVSSTRRLLATALLALAGACDSSTSPPPAVNQVIVSPATFTLASGANRQFIALLRDDEGETIEGRDVTWSVGDTARATVTSTGLVTAKFNTGTAAFTTTIVASAGGVSGQATLTIDPSVPTQVTVTPIAGTLTEGQQVTATAQLRDAANNVLAGRTITWASRDPSVATVTAGGVVRAAPFAGASNRTTRIVATVGSVADSVVVTVAPATVASIRILPEQPFLQPGWTKQLRIQGISALGNPVNGLTATYAGGSGAVATVTTGGLVTAATPGLGTTQVIATYGDFADTATVSVTACGAAPAGGYPLSVRFIGASPTAGVQAAFDCAVARIRAIIREPISEVPLNTTTPPSCFSQELNESTTGVIIFARVDTIDGPGQVLGRAGPCLVRNTSRLAVVGLMEFDDDDMANLEANGTLGAVIMHEMLHVIGIGTTWQEPSLGLWTGDVANPGFLGPRARAACRDEHGGATTCALRVPIEDCLGPGTPSGCGPGTRLGHWKENIFITELMTGYITGLRPPFSRMTIEALGDLGYPVDPDQSNDYVIPGSGLQALSARGSFAPIKMPAPVLPTHTVDEMGRVRPIPYF